MPLSSRSIVLSNDGARTKNGVEIIITTGGDMIQSRVSDVCGPVLLTARMQKAGKQFTRLFRPGGR